MTTRKYQLTVELSEKEEAALRRLALAKEWKLAIVVRELIKEEAKRLGLWEAKE